MSLNNWQELPNVQHHRKMTVKSDPSGLETNNKPETDKTISGFPVHNLFDFLWLLQRGQNGYLDIRNCSV
ncbi:hypothetical protein NQZ68_005268 [Dissostichus eleginoides]|nr:hypothetical protein NQZ68_005268 [Dissostichus eleginoides]